MQENQLLKRVVILDRQRQIAAYQLLATPDPAQGAAAARHTRAQLLDAFQQALHTGAPAPGLGYILHLPSLDIEMATLATTIPRPVIAYTTSQDLQADLSQLASLQQQSLSVMLTLPGFDQLRNGHLQAQYIQVAHWQSLDQVISAINAHPALLSKLILAGTHTSQDFDALKQLGVQWFSGAFYTQPALEAGKVTHPGFESVLNLLNLVSQDADNKTIEQGFKRDTTLSYKLLRYINSVGFGLSCEVQSLNHALTILGRQQLYRWLTLLLVTAGNHEACPALMKASIMRGRFMELLGEPFFDKSGKDNLFVVGVFSLLDRMLNQPMSTVLETLKLPEAMVEALTSHTGIYAPFLNLIMTLEQPDAPSASQAEALQLDALTVNRCHLQAIRWAEEVMQSGA